MKWEGHLEEVAVEQKLNGRGRSQLHEDLGKGISIQQNVMALRWED